MHRIYCIENSYIFWHLAMAIFRLRNEKNLVGSDTRLMWAVVFDIAGGKEAEGV